MRKGTIRRISKETQIQISLTIEGRGRYQVSTGIRFFDHMLELFAHHGGFDLKLKARGDLDVDQHHTVEDVGIVLGQAFDKALGSKRGILRAGYFLMPMDETHGNGRGRFLRTHCGGGGHESPRATGRRSAIGTGARLLRGLCSWRASQCSCARALRPIEPSQDRSAVQGLCPGVARSLLARSADGSAVAEHEGSAVMIAIVDYGAGNLVSVKKALDWLGRGLRDHFRSCAGCRGDKDRSSRRRTLCLDCGAWPLRITRCYR